MSYSANTISFNTTGVKNFAVGSSVQGYRISIAGTPTGIEGFDHRSIAVCTPTVQNCQATIDGQTRNFTEIAHLWTMSAGSIVDAIVGTHSSFNAGTGFSINLSTTSATWPLLVEIWT